MSYKDPSYVIFDGDSDKWAYAYMKGWKQNERIDFDFRDAHDLDNMTSRAHGEYYVKSHLRERMKKSNAAVVLIGEKTKNLYKFVRWELELALDLDLPIIAVNLNKKNRQDYDRCPAIIRDSGRVVHIPYSMAAIKHALDKFPSEYRQMNLETKNGYARHYEQFDS
ncbi:TIR domain-containing protein [Rhodopseudomonas palustris]|uniref:TIR domain-containing protein n=1 Tax=Rhodopseudomonas palustris TaxID=1076 RepID=UPI000CEC1ABD|nr:TIR domain-containing protein [Rhodopseudomonas palustris]PPQ45314.1 hypothetical protein CKO39_01040 [Rhodopseudomonas palustris]